MTINEVLDEMENLLLEAGRVPFTNKRIIEEDDLAQLLDELRDVLPSEVMEAKRIISERQRILDDAQQEAQNIVDQAKTYISRLTDENVISRQAQEQASEIIAQANKNSQQLHQDARTYAEDVFKHLENNLQQALEVIHEGHKELQQQSQNEN